MPYSFGKRSLPGPSSAFITWPNKLRTCRPNMRLLAAVMLVLAVLSASWRDVEGDIQKHCPSRCRCDLSMTPHVLCWDRFTLSRTFPHEARSFHCARCPIAKMAGDVFKNYKNLTQFTLEGSSRPIIEEQPLQFLKNIPLLEMKGYEVSASVHRYLSGHNHTLSLRISPEIPTSVTMTSSTSPAGSMATGYSRGDRSFPEEGGKTATSAGATDTLSTANSTNDDRMIPVEASSLTPLINHFSTGVANSIWVVVMFLLVILLLAVIYSVYCKPNKKESGYSGQESVAETSSMLNNNQLCPSDSRHETYRERFKTDAEAEP